jgi:release factor H-coupled RctB family protein
MKIMDTIDSVDKVRVIASPEIWMEGDAVQQLNATAQFPGMLRCVGMPDMQPGKGSPSGAAFLSEVVFPSLVGSDGGCGVGLHLTSLLARKARPEQIAEQLDGLDSPWDGDTNEWLGYSFTEPTAFDASLGTPGHGNHFIEIQQVEEVFDQDLFNSIGMDKRNLHLTIHSGSRGLGESILREYAAHSGAEGVSVDSEAGQHYIKRAAHAMTWAVANRQLCAFRVMNALGGENRQLIDTWHNSVTETFVGGCRCWLHRKGAAPADKGPVIIPGSRGDLTYVVSPVGEHADTLWSLAHGAGRKISRADARGKLDELYKNKDMRKNRWGGRLVCGDKSLLWEEAPECYKPINTVINSMVDAGLIIIVATLRPVVTFKTSEGAEKTLRRERKKWQMERSQARDRKRRR